MIWHVLRISLMLALLAIVGLVASYHTQLGLNYASLEVFNKPVATPALAPVTRSQWETETRPDVKAALEEAVFGPVPVGIASHVISSRIVDANYLDGRGVLEEYLIALGEGAEEVEFHLALATPKNATGPVPLMIGQTFCDNTGVFETMALSPPIRGRVCGMAENRTALGAAFMFIFGEYINKAPMEDYLDRGIAYANFFSAEIVPDTVEVARDVLARFPPGADGRRPTGAVAAWAAGYFAALDLLENDPRIDAARTGVFGHSRHGKSALVAGAWDPRIDLVISHQSGTGGASLSREKPGETVAQITDQYPHWFAPAYAGFADHEDALPIDQHHLIALIAPRPVLLGNGRRDVWSDPNGAYRAAIGASPAWAFYEAEGLAQPDMQTLNPTAGIAYHIRPGGHGMVRADIDAFLAFIEAHF